MKILAQYYTFHASMKLAQARVLPTVGGGGLPGRQVDIRPTLEKCQAIKKNRNFLHLIFDEIIAMPIQ